MIENCLRHKIIRDFLKHYTENRWKELIPSLIEIGILNLQKSFNKLFFTSEELKNVLRHLQISQIEKDKEKTKEKEYKDINSNYERKILTQNNSREKEKEKVEKSKLFKSHSKQKEKEKTNLNEGQNGNNNVININNNNIQRLKMIDSASYYNNLDKHEKIKYGVEAINEMKNNIKNNYHYFKNNISIDFKKKLSRQRGEFYKKIENKKINNQKKNIDKISYAISYDKDLRPASISRKINKTHNNTNNLNLKTDNDIIICNHNYSSEKKSKNNMKNDSKSKSKSKYHKTKEKFLNLNLNNLKRINDLSNNKKKPYITVKSNNKMDVFHTGGNEKNNFYKKIHMLQKHIITNEINHNYHVVKIGKSQINKMKPKQYLNNNFISNSYNNNYRNFNFINTLYQKVNTNEQAIKISNDTYFSNREELNDFILKNRIKLNIKNDDRKNLTKSERPVDRKNNILNIDEKDKDDKNNKKDKNINIISNNDEKLFEKNRLIKKIFSDKKNDKDIKYENELIKSYPNSNIEYMKLTKSKTPKKNTTVTEKDSISIIATKKIIDDIIKVTNKNDDNDIINDNNSIENKNNNNDINSGLKPIKIYDLNKDNNKIKSNDRYNDFEKVNGKSGNRYFNVFGCEGEDVSLTQMDRDCSGIIDSSTSNDIRMTQDLFFKESPMNVFKSNKSNEQSINSYHNSNDK